MFTSFSFSAVVHLDPADHVSIYRHVMSRRRRGPASTYLPRRKESLYEGIASHKQAGGVGKRGRRPKGPQFPKGEAR
jgi:hypothetical protein